VRGCGLRRSSSIQRREINSSVILRVTV
jgi:hypothetical protein